MEFEGLQFNVSRKYGKEVFHARIVGDMGFEHKHGHHLRSGSLETVVVEISTGRTRAEMRLPLDNGRPFVFFEVTSIAWTLSRRPWCCCAVVRLARGVRCYC